MLGFVHYITRFTILRFVVSRSECMWFFWYFQESPEYITPSIPRMLSNLWLIFTITGSGDLNTTIPHHFFDFLMERISAGSKKKRLPNSTQSIERNQPPRGKFTKYTWMLTNVLQVVVFSVKSISRNFYTIF